MAKSVAPTLPCVGCCSLPRTALLLLSSVRLASLWRKEQLLSREADREGGRWRGEGAARGELGVQLWLSFFFCKGWGAPAGRR